MLHQKIRPLGRRTRGNRVEAHADLHAVEMMIQDVGIMLKVNGRSEGVREQTSKGKGGCEGKKYRGLVHRSKGGGRYMDLGGATRPGPGRKSNGC